MTLTFHPAKRALTLEVRKLGFLEAALVFAGVTHTVADDRFDEDETRWVTYGLLRGRLVAIVRTQRGEDHHGISMRTCNDKEKRKHQARLA
jgi:uncharacterized DUF497 family protein